jgi:hypothetical protein
LPAATVASFVAAPVLRAEAQPPQIEIANNNAKNADAFVMISSSFGF